MKKYKHKVTEVVVTHRSIGSYLIEDWGILNPEKPVSINFDFSDSNWEEIKEEPNYLITAFRNKCNGFMFKIDKDGNYLGSCNVHNLKSMLSLVDNFKANTIEIYSVKNSKGEEFTIGEDAFFRTRLESNYPSTKILKFELANGLTNEFILATTEDRQGNIEFLFKSEKKKPIFISADGKEFYNDDTDYSLFSVLPKANWQENRYRLNDCIKFPKKEWLHFHTKEARQEYIDNNKPKYSLKDIELCYPSPLNSPLYETLMSNLKKLGK